MNEDSADQLLEHAGEVYADWRVAGHKPSDVPAFEKLCVQHPMLATYLKRIRKLDVGTRLVAEEEGAAAGGLALGEGLDVNRTAIEDRKDRPGKEAEIRARAMMEKVRHRKLIFGKYHLTGLTSDWSQIGKGGAGSVYRAWDEDLMRQVALKLLHKKYVDPVNGVDAGQRRRAQARFVHEAQLTAQLDHPGIVPLHDFGTTSTGRPYFTMKMVKGKTLGQVMELMHRRSGSWNLARTLGAFIKACETIAYAHDKGVIHRDLKPANIMVGKFGEVYVMDWGLLKRVERDEGQISPAITQFADLPNSPDMDARAGEGITDQGDALGTATYMSPEQAVGDLDAVGRGSDIYGLGAILYHILAGAAPFMANGQNPRVMAIIEAHRSGDGPDSIDSVAPRAPVELRRIVTKSMAYRPDDRYATATDMANELLAFIEGRVGKEWVSSPVRSTLRWARHRPSTALLMLLSVCIAGFLLFRAFRPSETYSRPVFAGKQVRAAVGDWVQENGEEELPQVLKLVGELVEADEDSREAIIQEIAERVRRAKALPAEPKLPASRLPGPQLPGEEGSR